ncbi:SHOCT domain-containing protein [Streptomyces sp. LX-29]|uniref:SHOCT domain-containing protein n=1 Tax=Streptomyces sp. LX-29 TaxID=2900152 RepID=UPI00240D084F|nr:SHOCT domain-containing protein [Streptomyces sp. LX-29]WFB06398.1 SHOCT domain-containing protein [Streptomyces sp. LX-29]
MDPLAHAFADGGGPGPWILLVPLVWALVVVGGIALLRGTVWRGRGPSPKERAEAHGEPSPIALLGRRFAAGEIDEDEYRRRLSVLDERFGRHGGGKGAAA